MESQHSWTVSNERVNERVRPCLVLLNVNENGPPTLHIYHSLKSFMVAAPLVRTDSVTERGIENSFTKDKSPIAKPVDRSVCSV